MKRPVALVPVLFWALHFVLSAEAQPAAAEPWGRRFDSRLAFVVFGEVGHDEDEE